jgi:hypothetical protein
VVVINEMDYCEFRQKKHISMHVRTREEERNWREGAVLTYCVEIKLSRPQQWRTPVCDLASLTANQVREKREVAEEGEVVL